MPFREVEQVVEEAAFLAILFHHIAPNLGDEGLFLVAKPEGNGLESDGGHDTVRPIYHPSDTTLTVAHRFYFPEDSHRANRDAEVIILGIGTEEGPVDRLDIFRSCKSDVGWLFHLKPLSYRMSCGSAGAYCFRAASRLPDWPSGYHSDYG